MRLKCRQIRASWPASFNPLVAYLSGAKPRKPSRQRPADDPRIPSAAPLTDKRRMLGPLFVQTQQVSTGGGGALEYCTSQRVMFPTDKIVRKSQIDVEAVLSVISIIALRRA